ARLADDEEVDAEGPGLREDGGGLAVVLHLYPLHVHRHTRLRLLALRPHPIQELGAVLRRGGGGGGSTGDAVRGGAPEEHGEGTAPWGGRLDVEEDDLVVLEHRVGQGPLERPDGLAAGVCDHHHLPPGRYRHRSRPRWGCHRIVVAVPPSGDDDEDHRRWRPTVILHGNEWNLLWYGLGSFVCPSAHNLFGILPLCGGTIPMPWSFSQMADMGASVALALLLTRSNSGNSSTGAVLVGAGYNCAVSMDYMRGQSGIQMLITAEQEAQQIISRARNMKMARLKQAKDEADQEGATYRACLEGEYQRKISEKLEVS
ncbi:hypothetical protein Taro_009192, partial [Colocasia esculenta]|nr:hypothetical protein [Colocasia esculenta]